jgi:hypothetical protein
MAFFNVVSFAQTAQARPDPARTLVRFVAQTLRAEGYDVVRIGNSLEIQGEIILELPYPLGELEDSGIQARLVPQADTSAEKSA